MLTRTGALASYAAFQPQSALATLRSHKRKIDVSWLGGRRKERGQTNEQVECTRLHTHSLTRPLDSERDALPWPLFPVDCPSSCCYLHGRLLLELRWLGDSKSLRPCKRAKAASRTAAGQLLSGLRPFCAAQCQIGYCRGTINTAPIASPIPTRCFELVHIYTCLPDERRPKTA